MLLNSEREASIFLTGVNIRCSSAHQCLKMEELSPKFWQRLSPDEKFERARSYGINEKVAVMLYEGYEEELCKHYETSKTDIIPRELLFDWFMSKEYPNLYFDTFKYKTVLLERGAYREIEEKDHDEMHTRFRSKFPWANYQESACYKKVIAFSQRNPIDTKIDKLETLGKTKKKHKDLIGSLADCLGIPEDEKIIARMYLSAWFTGLVQRSLNPGSKFDLVLVLNGDQGTGKTTFLENIFPGDNYVMSNSRDLDSKDKLVNLSTNSVVIWDEIGSFSSKYMIESIKQFLTLCEDSFRPVYARQTITRGRRCVFAATTNDPDVLEDLSGSRRFMVITVGSGGSTIDQQRVNRLMPELLSATLQEYQEGNLKSYFNRAQSLKQNENNEKYAKEEPVKDLIASWCNNPVNVDEERRDRFTTIEMAGECLAMPAPNITRSHTAHYGKILRNLGYKNKRARFGKELRNIWVYQKPRNNS